MSEDSVQRRVRQMLDCGDLEGEQAERARELLQQIEAGRAEYVRLDEERRAAKQALVAANAEVEAAYAELRGMVTPIPGQQIG